MIELLVVVAIIALLVSILLPSIARAKLIARIVKTHAELDGVNKALALYAHDHRQQLPPTRFSCSTRTAYELPVELGETGLLPSGRRNGVTVVAMADPFHADEVYRYRAVGAAVMNESVVMENAATLWVPEDFPRAETDRGRYHKDPATSPVRYAVWSVGPVKTPKKIDIPGRAPVPSRYWLHRPGDTGVITHIQGLGGLMYQSP